MWKSLRRRGLLEEEFLEKSPEDVPKETLIQLKTASLEGFLNGCQNASLKDSLDKFLEELLEERME